MYCVYTLTILFNIITTNQIELHIYQRTFTILLLNKAIKSLPLLHCSPLLSKTDLTYRRLRTNRESEVCIHGSTALQLSSD